MRSLLFFLLLLLAFSHGRMEAPEHVGLKLAIPDQHEIEAQREILVKTVESSPPPRRQLGGFKEINMSDPSQVDHVNAVTRIASRFVAAENNEAFVRVVSARVQVRNMLQLSIPTHPDSYRRS